jgi:AbrB family looped-hinge helix DNA binding protein
MREATSLHSDLQGNPANNGDELMQIARINAKGQITIPASIRKAANMNEGDTLTFEIKGDQVIVTKIKALDEAYLKGIEETLDEWSSPEDEAAWNGIETN